MGPTPLSVPVDAFSADRSRRLVAIVRYYRNLYKELERAGDVPYRMTKLGAWATSRAAHVFYFFKTIDLDHHKLFIDLGSGDGVVSCIAGLFTSSVGIEIDPDLCSMAQTAARTLRMSERVNFLCGNYLDQRFHKADCLYLYPDKPFDRLAKKLINWRGTVLVYGPHLPPEALEPAGTLRCGKEQMVLYRNS